MQRVGLQVLKLHHYHVPCLWWIKLMSWGRTLDWTMKSKWWLCFLFPQMIWIDMLQCIPRFRSLIALQVCYSKCYGKSFIIQICIEISIWHAFTGTNWQKKQLFVMAVCTPSGTTLPGNLTIVPSEQKWVFHAIYQLVFPHLYSSEVCSRNCLVLTDEDDAEYKSFKSVIETIEDF